MSSSWDWGCSPVISASLSSIYEGLCPSPPKNCFLILSDKWLGKGKFFSIKSSQRMKKAKWWQYEKPSWNRCTQCKTLVEVQVDGNYLCKKQHHSLHRKTIGQFHIDSKRDNLSYRGGYGEVERKTCTWRSLRDIQPPWLLGSWLLRLEIWTPIGNETLLENDFWKILESIILLCLYFQKQNNLSLTHFWMVTTE